jgi:hypothetical protein
VGHFETSLTLPSEAPILLPLAIFEQLLCLQSQVPPNEGKWLRLSYAMSTFLLFVPSLCGRCHVQHHHHFIPLHTHIDVYSVAIYSPVAELSPRLISELMLVV